MESTRRFRVTKGYYGWDNWYFRLRDEKKHRTLFLIDFSRGEHLHLAVFGFFLISR